MNDLLTYGPAAGVLVPTQSPFVEVDGLLSWDPDLATPEFIASWTFQTTLFGEVVSIDHLVRTLPDLTALGMHAQEYVPYGARTVEGPSLFPVGFCPNTMGLSTDLWFYLQTLAMPGGGLIVLAAPHAPGDQLARFREMRGDLGVHHVAVRVRNILSDSAVWRAKGFRPLSEQPLVEESLAQWFWQNAEGQIVELIERRKSDELTFDCRNLAGLRRLEVRRKRRDSQGGGKRPPLYQNSVRIPNNIPKPTRFKAFEKERLNRKQKLAAAFRVFGRYGFSEGIAGHITARDPEYPDHFWVNPFGVHFSLMKVSDLVLVNDKGEVVEGDRPVNEAAFAIHSQIHAARPDVVCAAHAHSIYGKSWSSLGRLIDPITQDACAFFEDHALFDDFAGVVLDEEQGKQIAAVLGEKKAVILRNHGLLTVGRTVDEAAWWFICLEHSCQAQLLAESVGKPIFIDPECARNTRLQVGSHEIGSFGFKPLYDLVVAQEPEFLE